ncbi:MAG: DUF1206 domain-containing protein [Gemmatimonadetes bacterium]|nr:DUF1206 domain-containing protein [Gemmatimonadota bacterium]
MGWVSSSPIRVEYVNTPENRPKPGRWVDWLARFGYAAKGVVYILVGALAARAAMGPGGETKGTRGALGTILEQPFGRVALAVVAVGLAGYVLWRLVQGFLDPEGRGSDFKDLGLRAFFVLNGLIYLSLAFAAGRLALGSGGGGATREPYRDWTARLMSQPHGRWLVAAVGLIVLGVALYQFVRAYKAKFRKRLKLREMSSAAEQWATRTGRFGFAARGVTFGLIASFLINAARQADPNEAKGLEGALTTIERQPMGPWLLAIVAIGLMAYGVFQLVYARYRRTGLEEQA